MELETVGWREKGERLQVLSLWLHSEFSFPQFLSLSGDALRVLFQHAPDCRCQSLLGDRERVRLSGPYEKEVSTDLKQII